MIIFNLQEVEQTDTGRPVKIKMCMLAKPTQELVKLIFNHDMFKDAMKSLEIGQFLN